MTTRTNTTEVNGLMEPKVSIERDDPTIVTDYVHPHSKNAGQQVDLILPPKVGGEFPVDENVITGTRSPRYFRHLLIDHYS